MKTEAVSGGYAWTTNDELAFLFGSTCYKGLLNASMDRINANRRLYGLKPVGRDWVIAQYKRNLLSRRFGKGCTVNPAKVLAVLEKWEAEQKEGETTHRKKARYTAATVVC